jgi:toxin secretion/phage lysis holin
MKNVLQSILAVIGGFLGYFLGGFDAILYTLIIFVVIDFLTGLVNGIINKNLSSEIGAKLIFNKILIFVLVGVANLVETTMLLQSCALRTATIFFYVTNEGISILENVSDSGLPVPLKLRSVLAKLREDKTVDHYNKNSK